MNHFLDYSDAIFDAFSSSAKKKDIIDKKQEIVDGINDHCNFKIDSILFVGFNPAILSTRVKNVYVTEVSDRVFQWIKAQNANVKNYDGSVPQRFDAVFALDEYLTFVSGEDRQKSMIDNLCQVTNKVLVTSVKDYKNQNFKDKEYSQPAIVRANNTMSAFVEIHDWSMTDKNAWTTMLYKLGSDAKPLGTFARRTVFFKQLAKFSIDAGAINFLVHPNLMYKSLIKKNYEHVISIIFDKSN